ncbi:patatin-like phospholipase domain-containing protein 1 [Salarias fasciatus]|uniref:patatin-like phospholipase domain-containing protein 1 n=1 Tax=Salarias fasciatus TaxID=181472 RepID=UPI001176E710|nr:patatin-like phospholipase domain-containing protein 1 [Salarias fasciatus]
MKHSGSFHWLFHLSGTATELRLLCIYDHKTTKEISEELLLMAPSYSSYTDVPRSISFSGSGFLATYQLGVAQCFLTCAPWMLRSAPCVLGASAGSLVAAAVVCEINLIAIRDELIGFARQLKAFPLGPLSPSVNVFHWLERVLHKYLPPDADRLSSGRLAVAVTRMTDGQQIVISEYHSKEDVVQALLCSCFVPGYCGFYPPTFKGVHYLDGGFSGIQPTMPLSSNRTLTVCPFSGEVDICPADPPCLMDLVAIGVTLKGNMANSIRIFNALCPLGVETVEQAFHNGYNDAIQFLRCHDLAPCLLSQKMFKEPQSCHQTTTLTHEEVTRNNEGVSKAEKDSAVAKSLNERRITRKDVTSEQDRTEYEPVKTTPLFSEVVNNAMVANMVSYLSKFGLPAWLVTYFLLPFLLFYGVFQNGNRLENLFRQMPDLLFWTWHNLRHCTFFFSRIVIFSIRENVKDRIMLFVLLLQWINVQTRDDTPRRFQRSSPHKELPAKPEDVQKRNVQNRLISPPHHYKTTGFLSMLKSN